MYNPQANRADAPDVSGNRSIPGMQAPPGYAGASIIEAVSNEQVMELGDLRDRIAKLEEALQGVLRPPAPALNQGTAHDVESGPTMRSPLLDSVKGITAQIRSARFQIDDLLGRIDL